MTTTPKLPVQPASKGSATLKSSKQPERQNYPRHTSERIRGRVHKRWDFASPGTTRAER